MATFDPIRIAAGRTYTRASVTPGQLPAYRSAPEGPGWIDLDENGDPYLATWPNPVVEGEMATWQDIAGSAAYYLYVAVDISGTLTWKKVSMGNYVGKYTNQPIDPLGRR